jgi:hypothetical protein
MKTMTCNQLGGPCDVEHRGKDPGGCSDRRNCIPTLLLDELATTGTSPVAPAGELLGLASAQAPTY